MKIIGTTQEIKTIISALIELKYEPNYKIEDFLLDVGVVGHYSGVDILIEIEESDKD